MKDVIERVNDDSKFRASQKTGIVVYQNEEGYWGARLGGKPGVTCWTHLSLTYSRHQVEVLSRQLDM